MSQFRSSQILAGKHGPQRLVHPDDPVAPPTRTRRQCRLTNVSGITVYLGDIDCSTTTGTPLVNNAYLDFYGDPGDLYVETGNLKSLSVSAAADNIIDCSSHGYTAGTAVYFRTLVGGAPLAMETVYYVIAANLAAGTFQVSVAPGGAAVDFTADITEGTVCAAADLRMLERFDLP